MPYCPFRHFPQSVAQLGFVRLACLIHAANVRSEPGSNPSKKVRLSRCLRSGLVNQKSLRSPLRHDSKNSRQRCFHIVASKDVSAEKAKTQPRFGSVRRLVKEP